MKKQRSVIIFIIVLFIFVLLTGLCSCYSYKYEVSSRVLDSNGDDITSSNYHYRTVPTIITSEQIASQTKYDRWRDSCMSKGTLTTGRGAVGTDLNPIKNSSTIPTQPIRVEVRSIKN